MYIIYLFTIKKMEDIRLPRKTLHCYIKGVRSRGRLKKTWIDIWQRKTRSGEEKWRLWNSNGTDTGQTEVMVEVLRSVSTTRVHGPSSRAELTARELGCIFWHPSTRAVNSGSGNRPLIRAVQPHRQLGWRLTYENKEEEEEEEEEDLSINQSFFQRAFS